MAESEEVSTKYPSYPHLHNKYDETWMKKVMAAGHGDADIVWEVYEKVHGSNILLWTDGIRVRAGRRRGWIAHGEKMWHVKELVHGSHGAKLRDLHSIVKSRIPATREVLVYGEYFGGSPGNKAFPPVQKGVYYGPDHYFSVFDVAYTDEEGNRQFLGGDFTRMACGLAGISFINCQHFGTLQDCIKYADENCATTTLECRDENKDNIPEENIREGVVLLPEIRRFMSGGEYVNFKHKNKKFAEKARASREGGGGARHHKYKKKKKQRRQVTKEGKVLVDIAWDYINDNRFNSVVSKEGQIRKEDFSRLSQLMLDDVIEDIKEGDDAMAWTEGVDKMPHDEYLKVRRRLRDLINAVVSRNLKNLCNADAD